MQRRLVVASVVTTVVAILLFAAPLAVVVHLVLLRGTEADLERTALRAASRLDPHALSASAGEVVGEVAAGAAGPSRPRGASLAVYRPDGTLVAGTGPAVWPTARDVVRDGAPVVREGTTTSVSVPMGEDGVVMAVVRAAEPSAAVAARTARAVAAMSALALLVVGLSVIVARRLARRVSAPIHELTEATRSLADGDFAVRVAPSGIRELDDAADALTETGRRLGALLEREAHFADDATHQLRTPLTGLRLALEAALARPDAEVRQGLVTVAEATERLAVVVDDLEALRRPAARAAEQPSPGSSRTGPVEVAAMVRERWAAACAREHRPLTVTADAEAPATGVPVAAVRQAVDAVLDNALRHGSGAVTVTVRATHGALAVDVADQGDGIVLPVAELFRRGVSTRQGRGIGLSLARSVVEAEGGRLELSSRTPTRFTLLLPGLED